MSATRYVRSVRHTPICKPGSVGSRDPDDHFSRRDVAITLKQPTRGVLVEKDCLSPPIWPCSNRGLPSHQRYRWCGGLLPHLFTLACHCWQAVCFLWHYPSKQSPKGTSPRRYLAVCPWSPDFPRRSQRVLQPTRSSDRCVPDTDNIAANTLTPGSGKRCEGPA